MQSAKHIGKTIAGILISAAVLLPASSQAHAQTVIGSSLKNAVTNAKQSAADNGATRNQLLASQVAQLQDKEQDLVDQLSANLLILENIQTRIAGKSAEAEASGTDMISVNGWLATSSSDIVSAQGAIAAFSAWINATSSDSTSQSGISRARHLADTAITAVNMVHDDLQSALDTLAASL